MGFTGASTMWQAIVIFFLSIFLAAGIALGGGAIIDITFNEFAAAGIFSVPAEWGDFEVYRYLIRVFYALCLSLPVIGAGYLAITIYHKYIIEDDEDEEYNLPYSGGNI